jgi:hypothetical protein
MSNATPIFPDAWDTPHLEVIAITGEVLDRGDVLKKSSATAWSLEDICYSEESSQRTAQTIAMRTNKECWVIDRKNGNRVTFRFTPAKGVTLSD